MHETRRLRSFLITGEHGDLFTDESFDPGSAAATEVSAVVAIEGVAGD